MNRKTILILGVILILTACQVDENTLSGVTEATPEGDYPVEVHSLNESSDGTIVDNTINDSSGDIIDEQHNTTVDNETEFDDPCEGIYNEAKCYFDLAIEKWDRALCAKAGFYEYKCVDNFILKEAVDNRNKTGCTYIIDDDLREVCYYKVRNQ